MKKSSRAFGVSRVEEKPPPFLRRSELHGRRIEGATSPAEALVHVFVAPDVHETLARSRAFSREVEEGGFLFGHVHRDADKPEQWIVVITEARVAEHAAGSLNDLAFSADSFASARRRAADGEASGVILGWYHTHITPEAEGLSVMDRDLHFTTFRRPWQVAALVCVDPARDPEGRRISFHARRDDFMARCTAEVLA